MTKSVIKLTGNVSSGMRKSGQFTELPWVKSQFRAKFGFDPVPGTFNITFIPEIRDKLEGLRHATGIDIVPQGDNYCAAKGFNVLINNQIKGAVIIPLVSGYPENQLEIVAAENIRKALSLKDGDVVEIDILV